MSTHQDKFDLKNYAASPNILKQNIFGKNIGLWLCSTFHIKTFYLNTTYVEGH